MASNGLDAAGLDRVVTTLGAAADDLADLSPVNQQVADMIVARTRPALPRRTGRLAASMRATATAHEATISFPGVAYARPRLFGAPRAGTRPAPVTPVSVIETARAVWLEAYTDHAQAVVDSIKGK